MGRSRTFGRTATSSGTATSLCSLCLLAALRSGVGRQSVLARRWLASESARHPPSFGNTQSTLVSSGYARLMTEETITALRNYDFLVRDRGLDDVQLAWDSDTVVYGDGGADIEILTEPGFTPATR